MKSRTGGKDIVYQQYVPDVFECGSDLMVRLKCPCDILCLPRDVKLCLGLCPAAVCYVVTVRASKTGTRSKDRMPEESILLRYFFVKIICEFTLTKLIRPAQLLKPIRFK